MVCPIAQEPDPGNALRLRWLIPVPHPCDCTELFMAGLNTAVRVVHRPFPVIYHDRPLVTNNATKIRKWLNCTPGKPGTTQTIGGSRLSPVTLTS